MNLFHPYGCSVNDHVDKDAFDSAPFILKFSSIDNITQDIKDTAEDSMGIKWNKAFYVDFAIAFGLTHGSRSFQILSDAVAYIMANKGVKLHCYIDDYNIVTSKLKDTEQFVDLCDLLQELGLPLNKSKVTLPTKRLTCLSIDIDITNNTMSIAQDKLEAIYEECSAVRNLLSKQAFQSLLGKLIYIQKYVKPSRIFVNGILELFRNNSCNRKIHLTPDFHKDIQWFLAFLPSNNGVSYITKTEVDHDQTLFLDACLTGMGAVWRNGVYATPTHNCVTLNLQLCIHK